jgi:hypothetical protein
VLCPIGQRFWGAGAGGIEHGSHAKDAMPRDRLSESGEETNQLSRSQRNRERRLSGVLGVESHAVYPFRPQGCSMTVPDAGRLEGIGLIDVEIG